MMATPITMPGTRRASLVVAQRTKSSESVESTHSLVSLWYGTESGQDCKRTSPQLRKSRVKVALEPCSSSANLSSGPGTSSTSAGSSSSRPVGSAPTAQESWYQGLCIETMGQ